MNIEGSQPSPAEIVGDTSTVESRYPHEWMEGMFTEAEDISTRDLTDEQLAEIKAQTGKDVVEPGDISYKQFELTTHYFRDILKEDPVKRVAVKELLQTRFSENNEDGMSYEEGIAGTVAVALDQEDVNTSAGAESIPVQTLPEPGTESVESSPTTVGAESDTSSLVEPETPPVEEGKQHRTGRSSFQSQSRFEGVKQSSAENITTTTSMVDTPDSSSESAVEKPEIAGITLDEPVTNETPIMENSETPEVEPPVAETTQETKSEPWPSDTKVAAKVDEYVQKHPETVTRRKVLLGIAGALAGVAGYTAAPKVREVINAVGGGLQTGESQMAGMMSGVGAVGANAEQSQAPLPSEELVPLTAPEMNSATEPLGENSFEPGLSVSLPEGSNYSALLQEKMGTSGSDFNADVFKELPANDLGLLVTKNTEAIIQSQQKLANGQPVSAEQIQEVVTKVKDAETPSQEDIDKLKGWMNNLAAGVEIHLYTPQQLAAENATAEQGSATTADQTEQKPKETSGGFFKKFFGGGN